MVTTTIQSTGIGDYLGALRRRYIYLITVLPAVMFISVVAAFGISPLYQSTATIMLELSSVPERCIIASNMSKPSRWYSTSGSRCAHARSPMPSRR